MTRLQEAYRAGFMAKCAEYGITPGNAQRLMKQAANDENAGIGSYYANGVMADGSRSSPVSTSYLGRLVRNWRDHGLGDLVREPVIAGPSLGTGRGTYDSVGITDVDLTRDNRASYAASKFYPNDSAPWAKLYWNLYNAGKANHEQYKETGDVVPRDSLDRSGIETLKLTPEQEEQIKAIQDTMVQNSKPRGSSARA